MNTGYGCGEGISTPLPGMGIFKKGSGVGIKEKGSGVGTAKKNSGGEMVQEPRRLGTRPKWTDCRDVRGDRSTTSTERREDLGVRETT